MNPGDNIHLMVTSLCNRDCKYCCNKQYDLNDVPYVTDAELKNAKRLFLTGGEPFAYSNPAAIARYYKCKYKNIEGIYVYTNAFELASYLIQNSLRSDKLLRSIDGVSVSIKNENDKYSFEHSIVNNSRITEMSSNYLYVFDNLMPDNTKGFKVVERKWQPHFVPHPNSIFRKV